ncbi:MAG TPA: class I SAM-dependent methyltransferase [Candidatus Hydrogenedentes bacterium]|nr:class I SAM-dependent methyltransferase [Candidatus Hydrogenedentota bacterium]
MDFESFFKLHTGIPREGPGSDEATLEALRRLPPLPDSPRVLDIGCGPGKQTLIVARELGVPMIGVDYFGHFLDVLSTSAKAAGLGHLIATRQADMAVLGEPPGSIDLIWCEGAIYIVGFEEGLRLWRPMLRDGGIVVASDATWLVEEPPSEIRAYWERMYPAITDVAENVRRAEAAGYEVFDHFVLPREGWWTEYYAPLKERSAQLRPTADERLIAILDENDEEIAMWERYGDSFSYVFYLMRKV